MLKLQFKFDWIRFSSDVKHGNILRFFIRKRVRPSFGLSVHVSVLLKLFLKDEIEDLESGKCSDDASMLKWEPPNKSSSQICIWFMCSVIFGISVLSITRNFRRETSQGGQIVCISTWPPILLLDILGNFWRKIRIGNGRTYNWMDRPSNRDARRHPKGIRHVI